MPAAQALANRSFIDACQGRRPERTPVWLMRQAGRYLPEYRAVREKVSFLELCRSPELCAEVTVQPIDRLGVDAAILFSDILVVFEAMGVEVDFTPGPVVAHPVRDAAAIAKLRFGDPREDIPYVADAVRACKAALGQRVPLIGFSGAPFTVTSYLVEGKGSRDFENIKGLMFREATQFGKLMESMTGLLEEHLVAQIEAGADAIQIFDSWAGAVAPRDYREFVLPHTKRLVAGIRGRHPDVPIIVFARGNAHHLEATREVEPDVIGVDWTIGLDDAIDVVGRDRVVQGNLDPMLLLGSPERLRSRCTEMLDAGRSARAHIVNLGHGISRFTDPEMAQLFVDVVHSHRYEA